MQNGTMRIVTPPPVMPVTLAEARAQVRQDFTTSDDELGRLIAAATIWAEDYMRRYVVQRAVELRLHCFPHRTAIELPGGDVAQVTALTYIDGEGTEQTFSDYSLDSIGVPAMLYPSYGNIWPYTRAERNAVTVRYLAGFAPGAGSPTDYRENIPEPIRSAILLHVEAHYDRDSKEMPGLLEAAAHQLDSSRLHV